MSTVKHLVKDTVIYGISMSLVRLLSLITFPLLTRHFTVYEFGIYDFFNVFANFIGLLIVFGQDSAVARYFYEIKEHRERQSMVSQSLYIQIVNTIICIILLFVLSERVLQTFHIEEHFKLVLYLTILQAPFYFLINFVLNILKWSMRQKAFLYYSLFYSIFSYITIFVLVKGFNSNIENIFFSLLIIQIIFSIIGLWIIREWLVCTLKFNYVKKLYTFAIPLGIISISSAFSPTLERTIILNNLDVQLIGIYAVAFRIASLLSILISAFQTSWGPFSLSIHQDPNSSSAYNLTLSIFTFVFTIFTFGISLSSNLIVSILAGDKYNFASILVFPLLLAQLFQSVGWITEVGISISKKSYLNLFIHLSYFIILMSSMFLFTKVFGIIGVPYSLALAALFKTVISSVIAQRANFLNWHYTPAIINLSILTFIGITANILKSYNFYLISSLLYISGIFILILINNSKIILLAGFVSRLNIFKRFKKSIAK